jgi:hypothetical protein
MAKDDTAFLYLTHQSLLCRSIIKEDSCIQVQVGGILARIGAGQDTAKHLMRYECVGIRTHSFSWNSEQHLTHLPWE